MRLSRAVPTTLLAIAMVVPTLPAVGQDAATDGSGDGTEAVDPSVDPDAPDATEVTPSPSAAESAPADVVPSATSGPESADSAPSTVDERAAPSLADTVATAAATAADDQVVLPVDDDGATCPKAAIDVTWEPVPADSFEIGGFVEPLVAPVDDTTIATGIATCLESPHAVAGFDAVPTSGGGWDIHFVAPTSETEEGLAPAAPTGTKQAEPELGSLEAAIADQGGAAATSSQAAGSVPVPDWPSGLPAQADDLSASDPQDICDPTDKPGALALKDLLDRTYQTTGGYAISRDCSSGGRSEHKEGRALDWMVDSYDANQKAIGDTFTEWVLSTDPWDNDFAGMRRLGIMYMIWNRRGIYSWNPEAGWRDYTGVSDHTDHVHFSMTWPGARCETTFWEATSCTGDTGSVQPDPPEPPAPPPTLTGDLATAVPADFDGDGYEDVLWYRPGTGRDPQWWGGSSGFDTGGSTSVDGSYLPLHGDFDGDGHTDIIWYGPGSARDSYWQGQGDGSFVKGLPMRVRGVYEPTVGDFDGNGIDDVLWYGPGSGSDSIWYGTRSGFDSARNIDVQGSYLAVAVDMNGDRRDDILWYGRGEARDSIWAGRSDRTFATGIGVRINANATPIAGDFNANGREDVFFYAAGDAVDESWYFRRDFTTRRDTTVQIRGSYRPFAGDFDGDDRDDIFWYGPGTGSDWIYYGGPNGFQPASTSVSGDYQPVAGG